VAVQAQQADGQAAQRGHHTGRVSCPDQRFILLMSHVADPVKPVFYLPVAADPGRQGGGLLPLIVLFGARRGGLRLAPGFENWAITIAMIWAAVACITLLDPLYANRIKTVREFIDAFRGIA
jgi:hypothetical protein